MLQLNSKWEDVDANLKNIEKQIANSEKSDILVLPEMFNTGFTNNVNKCAETFDGKTVSWMKFIAKKTDTAICGSLIIVRESKFYNCFVFVKPDGSFSFYDKRHLFRMGNENDTFSGGDSRIIVEYKSFRILLQVCYDLRFPVWSRNNEDYDIIFYVASWPDARREIWDILLKARAIENQSYIVAVNRVGTDGNNLFYSGGTYCIDPKGNILAEAKNNEEVLLTVSLDKSELLNFRSKFPAYLDRDKFEIL